MDYGDTERWEPVSQGKRKPPGADRAGHAISPSHVGGSQQPAGRAGRYFEKTQAEGATQQRKGHTAATLVEATAKHIEQTKRPAMQTAPGNAQGVEPGGKRKPPGADRQSRTRTQHSKASHTAATLAEATAKSADKTPQSKKTLATPREGSQ